MMPPPDELPPTAFALTIVDTFVVTVVVVSVSVVTVVFVVARVVTSVLTSVKVPSPLSVVCTSAVTVFDVTDGVGPETEVEFDGVVVLVGVPSVVPVVGIVSLVVVVVERVVFVTGFDVCTEVFVELEATGAEVTVDETVFVLRMFLPPGIVDVPKNLRR